eukprot:scaffold117973_cov21-Tisochrysis_lutea.AAC.2
MSEFPYRLVPPDARWPASNVPTQYTTAELVRVHGLMQCAFAVHVLHGLVELASAFVVFGHAVSHSCA